MTALSIQGWGMVTGVGLCAVASCAAIRAGINGFVETSVVIDGVSLIGCPVPGLGVAMGQERWLALICPAIQEALGHHQTAEEDIPLLLSIPGIDLPAPTTPAPVEDTTTVDDALVATISRRLGKRFSARSRTFPSGRMGGALALAAARDLIRDGARACLLAGVDSLVDPPVMTALHERGGLAQTGPRDGCVPGEGAAAVVLGLEEASTTITGLGFGTEPAPRGSGRPLRGDGLVEAVRAAFADAGCGYDQVDTRISDLSGDQYGFKESALCLSRTLRLPKQTLSFWHPADCLGEMGAAAVPMLLALAAGLRGHPDITGPGVLCHISGDGPGRCAIILQHANAGATNV